MFFRPSLIFGSSLFLTGCSYVTPPPHVRVTPEATAGGQSQIARGAIPFRLESSAINFSEQKSTAGGSKPSAPPPASCESKGSNDWTTCLLGVQPVAGIVAAERGDITPDTARAGDTRPAPKDKADVSSSDKRLAFFADPDNGFTNHITTLYTFSSTPVGDDELLLKQITIADRDNLKNILSAAGAGAAAGAAFGPVGLGAGVVLGFGAGFAETFPLNTVASFGPRTPEKSGVPISTSVCVAVHAAEDDDARRYRYDDLAGSKALPELGLPFAIKPGDSLQFMESKCLSRISLNRMSHL